MSRTAFKNEMKTVKAKFCKICKDSGKSETEYTSHFIRETPDPRSKVVCPTLLNTKCRCCGGIGHMPTFCGIAQNKAPAAAPPAPAPAPAAAAAKSHSKKPQPKKPVASSHNAFACLMADDEQDEVCPPTTAQPVAAQPVAQSGKDYAAALAQPVAAHRAPGDPPPFATISAPRDWLDMLSDDECDEDW